MAASIKISELNSLSNLTDVDLFLVSDMETGTSKKVSYNTLKTNVTSELSTAVTDLTSVVSQNRTDAETLVETVRAALQAAVDANATGFAAGDSALDGRLDLLEIDPTTQTIVDDRVNALNAAITAVSDKVDNLDIDIAPETLNSINELAAAMGDDPAFLTTLQGRLDVIEGDNATQTELDATAALKLNIDAPVFTGVLSGPDLAIDTDKLTISSAGGVVASVGFFTGGMLTVGGNASFTGNATFSAGIVNFANGIRLDGTELTSSATEFNYVTGVTSSIQSQIDAINTTISNLDIGLAPEALNSINELAQAMGDNPDFLTTITTRVSDDEAALAAYKAYVDEMNFQLMLAYDTPVYIDTLFGG